LSPITIAGPPQQFQLLISDVKNEYEPVSVSMSLLAGDPHCLKLSCASMGLSEERVEHRVKNVMNGVAISDMRVVVCDMFGEGVCLIVIVIVAILRVKVFCCVRSYDVCGVVTVVVAGVDSVVAIVYCLL